jgi:hypothetical protein
MNSRWNLLDAFAAAVMALTLFGARTVSAPRRQQ